MLWMIKMLLKMIKAVQANAQTLKSVTIRRQSPSIFKAMLLGGVPHALAMPH